MDTCEFSYISRIDSMPKEAWGIEQSWEQLKIEMGRTGPGYPGAIYFKTMSPQGPKLFAVIGDNIVLYHDQGEWHRYITAYGIRFNTKESTNPNPDRATNESDWVLVSQQK